MKESVLALTFLLFSSQNIFAKGDECSDHSRCEVKKNSNGEKDGEEKCFSHNNKLRREAHYKNGSLHGAWKCFDESGKLRISKNFLQGQEDGSFKQWNDEAQQYEECHFKQDKKHGACKTFQTSRSGGKNKLEGSTVTNYQDGDKHGWQIIYDASGKEKRRICYERDRVADAGACRKGGAMSSKKTELVEVKDRNGRVAAVESLKDGRLDGVSKYFNKDGKLINEVSYENGNIKGWETRYFSSGKPEQKILWQAEGDVDQMIYFYENGKTRYEMMRREKGKQLAPDLYHSKFYFDNGQLESEGSCWISSFSNFRSCLRMEGPWAFYDSKGKLMSKGSFVKGKREGVWELHTEERENGKTLQIVILETYKDDIRLSMIKKDKLTARVLASEEYRSDGSVKEK